MQIFAARVSAECNTKMYLFCVSELRGARPVRQYCRISRRTGVQEGRYPDSARAEYWRHRGLVAVLTAWETGQASATILLPPRAILVLCCHLMLVIFLLYHSIPPLVFIVPLVFLLMSYAGIVTRLRAGRSGVRNWARVRNFTLSRLATQALGPTQLRCRYFPVTKRSGMMMNADLHKAEIKSGWSCTAPPPRCLHNVDEDNFTFWVLSFSCFHLLVFCHIFFPFILYSFPQVGRPFFAFSFSSIWFPCSN